MTVEEQVFKTFSRKFNSHAECIKCNYNDENCLCIEDSKRCINCLTTMFEQYSPTYGWCSNLRDAYILKYFFVHRAELMKTLLYFQENIIQKIENFDGRPLKVASIGLGPGTDFAAVVETLLAIGEEVTFHYCALEKEEEWKEQYRTILNLYRDKMQESNVNCHNIVINNSDVMNVKYTKKKFDLFIMSYVISEITNYHTDYSDLHNLWSWLKYAVHDECVILLNDRNETMVRNYLNAFEEIVLDTYPSSEVHKFYFNPDGTMNEYGELHPERSWCGVSFPDGIRDAFQSKLKCNSCQLVIFIKKG